jgi:hypothetical protein
MRTSSRVTRSASSRLAGQRAPTAASHSIQPATSASGATVTPTEPDGRALLDLLTSGQLELLGQLRDASNAAFVGNVSLGPRQARVIYKPTLGERRLWDFPYGTLGARERAAYQLSEFLGWQIVPPTVLRDGPAGAGMVQLWIEADPSIDMVELINRADDRLRRICLFDALANNADRKVGHVLPTVDGELRGIDHGVCFAAEPKLRTVLWAWRGESLSAAEKAAVERVRAGLDGSLGTQLAELLSPAEVDAAVARVGELLASGVFPQPNPNWPALPWPLY